MDPSALMGAFHEQLHLAKHGGFSLQIQFAPRVIRIRNITPFAVGSSRSIASAWVHSVRLFKGHLNIEASWLLLLSC